VELNDALIITLVGLVVVFVGLVLTQLMIHSFSLIPWLILFLDRFKNKERKGAVAAVAVQEPVAKVEIKPVGPVEAEIVAVITAVLEVELRLRASLIEGKFTFSK